MVASGVLAVFTLLVFGPGPAAQTPPIETAAVRDVLDRYARGDYDGAVHAIANLNKLDQAFDGIRLLTPRWIHEGGSTEKRRLTVATVALEIAHARQASPWRLRWPFVAWACELVRDNASHWSAERLWFLLSIAVIEEAGDWTDLTGAPTDTPYMPARRFFSAADQQEFRLGHLSHARAAFPAEPRVFLAEVIAHEHATLLGTANGPPPRGIGAEELPDSLIADLRRRAAGERVDAVADVTMDNAKRQLARIAQGPSVTREFESLSRFPELRGEIELHLGFSALRAQSWDEAIAHLQRVSTYADEPFLVGLSHYFSGWVHQRAGRRDEAIAAYERGLALTPRARTLSVLLAAQLGEAGRTADGYGVLDAALRPGPPVSDPWTLFGLGDARLYGQFVARIRELLK